MSLRGRLEDLGVGEILHVVGAARRSGLLRIAAGSSSADVLFRDGAVVGLRGAGMPASLADLLGGSGGLDEAARARATAVAQESGVSFDEALRRVGIASSFRVQQAIEAEIERRLPALLQVKAGSFEFSLLQDTPSDEADFGAMALEHGIPVARVGASRGSRLPPESAGETTGARRARLLVAEDRIALPGSPAPTPPSGGPGTATLIRQAVESLTAPRPAAPAAPAPVAPVPTAPVAPATRPGRTVLHCLQAGPLRQRLLAGLAETGAGALAITSGPDLDAGIEAARSRGEAVALACQAAHPDLPGLELLARLRAADASAPAVLLLPADWPVGRQSVAVDRAERLGARVLALVTDEPGGLDDVAGDLCARLLDLLARQREQRPAEAPVAGSDVTELGLDVERAPEFQRRGAVQLAPLARWISASGETAEVVREILWACSEHADRCVILARRDATLELLGYSMPDGHEPPPLSLTGHVAYGGADFLSRAVRDGMPLDGAPPSGPSDAPMLRALGADRAMRVTLLPLLAAGSCFGALVMARDDGEDMDIATLSSFMVDAGPAAWEALSRERRRLESRRQRTGTGASP